MMADLPLLTILVFFPLAGCLLMLPAWKRPAAARPLALGVMTGELLLALWLYASWQGLAALKPALPGYLLVEDAPWIAAFGIRYTLGLDGISLLMVMLTAFSFCVALVVSWRAIGEKVGLFLALLLAMETGIMGVFLALDLALFYLFWEVMLIPMFFLIGIWGHGRRIYSTVKFFLFTMFGSLLMLLAIIALHLLHAQQSGVATFGLFELIATPLPAGTQLWLFAAFFLAFAIKFPLFPLHTWLPDAHTDAPTAGSVILAGLLLKTGSYGLIRFGYPLFPQAAQMLTPLFYTLAIFRDHLCFAGGLCPGGHEAPDRLFQHRPHGVRGHRHRRLATGGPVRLDHPDGQPRRDHRRTVRHGRDAGRAGAHPGDRRLRRAVGQDPALVVLLPDLLHGLGRPAGTEQLRGRVPGAGRHLHQGAAGGGTGLHRHRPDPGLHGAAGAGGGLPGGTQALAAGGPGSPGKSAFWPCWPCWWCGWGCTPRRFWS